MRISHCAEYLTLFLALVATSFAVQADDSSGSALPPFSEVYDLVRSNLTGASEFQLNRAAVLGFVAQLQPRVKLITNGTPQVDSAAVPLVSKAAVLDGSYGFVRIARVSQGLPEQVSRASQRLLSTNKLQGIVIDLRFASGWDYQAAAAAADLFFKAEQPLLQVGDVTLRSTAKANPIELPVVVLINQDTSGAAEALAAALRQSDGAVIIGSPSAGQAYLFKEFPLQDGDRLRVAEGQISAGDGHKLPDSGVQPDIRIALSLADEKAYFEDPYKVLAKPFAQAAKPGTNDLSSVQGTNRSRRRLNEAELVRMQRDGSDFDTDPAPVSSPQPGGPVITDPALSRALDLLKGLSLALKRH